jgi:hypothetical protein
MSLSCSRKTFQRRVANHWSPISYPLCFSVGKECRNNKSNVYAMLTGEKANRRQVIGIFPNLLKVSSLGLTGDPLGTGFFREEMPHSRCFSSKQLNEIMPKTNHLGPDGVKLDNVGTFIGGQSIEKRFVFDDSINHAVCNVPT